MTTGVTVITVTTTRTHFGLNTDGWYDNWTWETDVAPTVLPAPSPPQLGPSSSTAVSSAGFTEGRIRTASSAQNTVPNVSDVHSTVRVTDVETGETYPLALVLHALCTKDLDWLEHVLLQL